MRVLTTVLLFAASALGAIHGGSSSSCETEDMATTTSSIDAISASASSSEAETTITIATTNFITSVTVDAPPTVYLSHPPQSSTSASTSDLAVIPTTASSATESASTSTFDGFSIPPVFPTTISDNPSFSTVQIDCSFGQVSQASCTHFVVSATTFTTTLESTTTLSDSDTATATLTSASASVTAFNTTGAVMASTPFSNITTLSVTSASPSSLLNVTTTSIEIVSSPPTAAASTSASVLPNGATKDGGVSAFALGVFFGAVVLMIVI